MRYHFSPIRLAKIEKVKQYMLSRLWGNRHTHITRENANCITLMEGNLAIRNKTTYIFTF